MLVTGQLRALATARPGSVAVQSFGQEYSDGKSRGLDPEQAAGRAGAFAAFEVIGEKFGFKGDMTPSASHPGMTGDALAGLSGQPVKKETRRVRPTTGQFAVTSVHLRAWR